MDKVDWYLVYEVRATRERQGEEMEMYSGTGMTPKDALENLWARMMNDAKDLHNCFDLLPDGVMGNDRPKGFERRAK